MEKPDVDAIEGLSPAISIEQKIGRPQSALHRGHGHRDLRLPAPALRARRHAALPELRARGASGRARRRSPSRCSPGPRARASRSAARSCGGARASSATSSRSARKQGFVRAMVDGELVELADPPKLNRRAEPRHLGRGRPARRAQRGPRPPHRLARDGAAARRRPRGGRAPRRRRAGDARSSRRSYGCPDCGISLPELEPRHFSFNSPFGACETCSGLGTTRTVERRSHPRRPAASRSSRAWCCRGESPTASCAACCSPDSRSSSASTSTRRGGAGHRGAPAAAARARRRRDDAAEAQRHQARAAPRRPTAAPTSPRGRASSPTCSAGTTRPAPTPCASSSRATWSAAPCPDVRRAPPAARVARRHGARPQHRRAGGALGRSTRSRSSRRVPGARQRQARARPRHRRPDPQGSARPPALPRGRGARLPHARPLRRIALRRRGAAHPAGHADRLAPRRACSTSSTSRASGCTSATTPACSARSSSCATWATP